MANETTEVLETLKWMSVATRFFKLNYDRRLQTYRLSSSLYYYILRIKDAPGITQDRLIEMMYLNASNITRGINQLVDLGYVRKVKSTDDRRVYQLFLTDAGEEIYPIIINVREEITREMFAGLSKSEQQQFSKMMKVVANSAIESLN